MEKEDTIDDIRNTYEFFKKVLPGPLHDPVITLTLELDNFLRIYDDPDSKVSDEVLEIYLAHIRRSFLLSIFNMSESIIRQEAESHSVLAKSKDRVVFELLEKVEEAHPQTKGEITKIKKELSVNFVEFPRILDGFLSKKIPNKSDRKRWRKLFSDLGSLRNSAHNNYVSRNEHRTLSCKKMENFFTELDSFFQAIGLASNRIERRVGNYHFRFGWF